MLEIMENANREKLIEEMKALRDKRISEIKALNERNGIYPNVIEESQQITVKYLGKMEFTVAGREELVEKDVFMTIEEIDGQYQIRYYDEDQKLLGIQRVTDEDIILSSYLSTKTTEEQRKIQRELDAKDKEEAKTLEELEEEQTKEEAEAQQLPGLQDGPQLTRTQVNTMKGPKTELNQIIDEETLGNVIGLEGKYMQIVDADTVRKLIPDIEIPTSQKTIPIEIFPDGSANVIGEDKLQFSAIEGTNSFEEHVTMTNDGKVRNEQNLETYNIVSKGKMHTIAVGYDENNGAPLEIKYGRRDIENPRDIAYADLESVHFGPLQQDDRTQQYQEEASGIDKGQDTIEAAVEKYAIAMNIRKTDMYGYPTSEYDLETAKQELEERWAENPDATLDELIEEDQKQLGPEDNRIW